MKLILFDLDNTLIDRDDAFRVWLNSLCADENRDCMAEKENDIILLDKSGYEDRRIFAKKLSQMLPCLNLSASQILELHRDFPIFIRPDDTVNNTLRMLKEKYILAIVTNGSGPLQREKIKRAGFQKLFSSVFISGELGIRKPDKRMFLLPMEKYGVKPGETIMIGDDETNDILGAKALGIKTILISDRKDVKTEADALITGISEIDEAIKTFPSFL